ncbi:MAG: sensor histidine kinase [Longimicrobiales bacterium]
MVVRPAASFVAMRPHLSGLVAGVAALAAAFAVLLAWLAIPAALRDVAPADARGVRVELRSALLFVGVFAVLAAALAGWLIARPVTRTLGTIRDRVAAFPDLQPQLGRGALVRDVHELTLALQRAARAAEQRFAAAARERDELALLIRAAGEGFLQIDGDGRIARFNPAAASLLGLPEAAVGQSYGGAVRSVQLRSLIQRSLAGEQVEAAEIVLAERHALALMNPVEPSRGPRPAGVVVILVNLTQVRRLEAARRDFVANASHELKTPLTSIRGYAETLLSDDPPEETRRAFLTTIRDNAGRLQRIVDDLLALSSVESGRWEPEIRPLDLAAVVDEAWSDFRERAAASGIRFDRSVDHAARTASADPLALRQILTNLFDNALRHTPEGGRITVRIGTAPPNRRVVEVADSGSGIPRDALPRVFERFYRVDPARSRQGGGTGLGLAIVKHLVESLGGRVVAESELGKGTTVRFDLPGA